MRLEAQITCSLIGLVLAACTTRPPPPAASSAPNETGTAPEAAAASAGAPARSATPAPASTLPLPGRNLSVTEAATSASAIVIGKLTRLGTPSPEAPGQSYYDGAEAKVVRTIAGNVPDPIPLTYTVQTIPESIAEQIPVEGTEYVMFLKKVGNGYRAIKMLAPTPENLKAVDEARAKR